MARGGGKNMVLFSKEHVHSARKRARPMTSRSQVEGTGRKTCALVLIDLTLLTDDEREPESWLLRKRSLSSDSSSVTWLASSAGPALLLGDRDSHLA